MRLYSVLLVFFVVFVVNVYGVQLIVQCDVPLDKKDKTPFEVIKNPPTNIKPC